MPTTLYELNRRKTAIIASMSWLEETKPSDQSSYELFDRQLAIIDAQIIAANFLPSYEV